MPCKEEAIHKYGLNLLTKCEVCIRKYNVQKPWPADNFKKYKRKQIPKKKAIF